MENQWFGANDANVSNNQHILTHTNMIYTLMPSTLNVYHILVWSGRIYAVVVNTGRWEQPTHSPIALALFTQLWLNSSQLSHWIDNSFHCCRKKTTFFTLKGQKRLSFMFGLRLAVIFESNNALNIAIYFFAQY